jgi:hypothetical protein
LLQWQKYHGGVQCLAFLADGGVGLGSLLRLHITEGNLLPFHVVAVDVWGEGSMAQGLMDWSGDRMDVFIAELEMLAETVFCMGPLSTESKG